MLTDRVHKNNGLLRHDGRNAHVDVPRRQFLHHGLLQFDITEQFPLSPDVHKSVGQCAGLGLRVLLLVRCEDPGWLADKVTREVWDSPAVTGCVSELRIIQAGGIDPAPGWPLTNQPPIRPLRLVGWLGEVGLIG